MGARGCAFPDWQTRTKKKTVSVERGRPCQVESGRPYQVKRGGPCQDKGSWTPPPWSRVAPPFAKQASGGARRGRSRPAPTLDDGTAAVSVASVVRKRKMVTHVRLVCRQSYGPV